VAVANLTLSEQENPEQRVMIQVASELGINPEQVWVAGKHPI
jgi:methenyltetrahydromethanopterin cyclohydrolase